MDDVFTTAECIPCRGRYEARRHRADAISRRKAGRIAPTTSPPKVFTVSTCRSRSLSTITGSANASCSITATAAGSSPQPRGAFNDHRVGKGSSGDLVARPETTAAAVTRQAGEGFVHCLDAAAGTSGNDDRMSGAEDVACPVDRYGTRARDADQ